MMFILWNVTLFVLFVVLFVYFMVLLLFVVDHEANSFWREMNQIWRESIFHQEFPLFYVSFYINLAHFSPLFRLFFVVINLYF